MLAVDTNGVVRLLVNDGAVATALDGAGRGLELVDALHAACAPEGASFVTFDRGLARAGRKLRTVRLA